MKNKHEHFQDFLEWEIIDEDIQITNLSFEKGLYKLNKDCVITFSRNSHQDLVGTISGILEHPRDLDPKEKEIPGTFIENEVIIGYTNNGIFKYKISGIALGALSINPIVKDLSAFAFESELIFDSIEKNFNGYKSETDSIQEWYLSGKTSLYFPRSTGRSVEKKYTKSRNTIDSEEEYKLDGGSGSSKDFLFVNGSGISFIVAEVPKEYGPDWSNNIVIEYRKSFGKIPSDDERKAIAELVGFVFGNQLLKIGQTSYSKEKNIAIQEYKSPWGDNVFDKCQKPGFAPVYLKDSRNFSKVENLLNSLLPNYLKLGKSLQISDALWKYWIARQSSLGTNLPILSSAIETLAENILKSHTEYKSFYIEYKEFNELIKEELNSIETKLSDKPFKDKVLNKLKGAAQRGSNEKLEMMFEILNIQIGKIERSALKARNKMAHSSIENDNIEDIKATIRLTRAYETLFHRVILKILSYDGDYIDYYTFGHPSRNIDDYIAE